MKKLLLPLAFASIAATSWAVTPLWLRDVKISPDGSSIAFTYKGDIYKVAANGGTAQRLTTQPSYESNPVWSPDGKSIAFASDRNGNMDVYLMSANGGKATRLTTNSTNEIPESFTPDGKNVLFSAAIQDVASSAQFPSSRLTEVYSVPVTGGRITQLLSTPALQISYSPDGDFFLYNDQKGFEDEWRKHHTSSVTRDVWRYDTKTGKHTNLTNRAGEDRNPVVSVDGKTVYLLSERNGNTFNVYSFPIDNPSAVKQLTNFKTHPVRFLSQGADGTLAFTYDGEIYTKKGDAAPRKVNIDLMLDEENPIKKYSVSSSNEATVSPDGKQVAFVNRGELFVTSVEYPTTKQITSTPAAERQPAWAPDNRTIAYTSEREGHPNIYVAKINRKDDANFPNATLIDETPLVKANDGVERTYPKYSPDGKEIAFIQDRRKLMVMNLDTKKVRQITDGSTYPERNGGFDYKWSPDGKWFVIELTGNGHEPYSDIAIVNATGTPKVTNITRSSYFDMEPQWVMDGNAIAFVSDRYGLRSHASWGSQNDIMLAFLNQDAYDKYRLSKEDYELRKELEKQQKKDKEKAEKEKSDKKDKKNDDKKEKSADGDDDTEDIVVELDGIEDRIVRVTPASSDIGGYIFSKDGENLYYLAAFEKAYDLWKINLRKRDVRLINKLNTSPLNFGMDKKGDNIFLLGSSSLKKMNANSESMTPITFSAILKLDPAAEREYMFDYVKQEEKERFYNKNMHGIDWEAMTKAYRKFLPHINNNYDFAELLSELLGELNVSHTGGRYRPSSSGDRTASLGLLYDWTYTGKGLKVDEIIEKGPFDRKNSDITVGCIIEKINGEPIDNNTDYTAIFNDIAGKKTLVTIHNPADNKTWDEVILPISSGTMNTLLYNRWVKQRAADVDKWSGGRLGYVHLESMDDASYRTIYADLLGKYVDKDGIVIDTRWNGGGRLHEDIEVLFSGKKYLTQVIRGEDICDMPSRRWNKPSIMVQCEANYSNAHGTPWVYKHLNIGKLVGMPVPGTMTSVNWVTMQDPSLVFGIPVIGYRTAEGNYLENSQLEPDFKVVNEPGVIVTGEDQQLRKAVEELLKEIDAK
ncbi:S41 family peptidase [uncultured Muribaculum sp.]|uniref:S41 family peptidase n=3 Tax=uncultured Muribaculum sp. TaxID=1918613 RepID=UPI002731E426|nr:S41 family peptidase [uncultured Muribaculum sp.]